MESLFVGEDPFGLVPLLFLFFFFESGDEEEDDSSASPPSQLWSPSMPWPPSMPLLSSILLRRIELRRRGVEPWLLLLSLLPLSPFGQQSDIRLWCRCFRSPVVVDGGGR
jgi:hypothetical protein